MSARDALPIASVVAVASPSFSAPATLIRDYLVQIQFEDGEFEAAVKTTSAQQAYHMALIDARMGNRAGTFFLKEVGHTVDLIELESMQV